MRVCDNCKYLCSKEGDNFCHITNPGTGTKIEDPEDDRCPRWESKKVYGRGNTKPRKKPVEEFITYEILR